ncbi:MAG: pyruvate dehydrogenase complex dihydrolipoamide acetyltransferase, partial [Chitinophagaceae bacterium]|nr:pyruvate dehydrogenase complex dihydrolipoamide acetyltransferase [Chitinophagaceae bacterium]
MAEVILMPRLSDTMTEGVIAAWHKKVGDKVKKGDLLAEVETDKATMELESYKDGTLLHIGVDKGGKLQVNDLLAIIGNAGEDVSGLIKGNKDNAAKAPAPAAENSKPEKKEEKTAVKAGAAKPVATPTAAAPALDISKMEEVVLMPRLSDTMTEGVIASWQKNVGDAVKKGDLLAEIETDKATMELESYKNGELLYIGAKKGEKIAVNDLLCIIGEKGKVDVDAIVAAAKSGGAAPVSQQQEGTKEEAAQSATTEEAHTESGSSENGRVKASPLAKKLAAEKGVDLKMVQGTGDGGRIVKNDIDNYVPKAETKSQPPQKASAPAVAAGDSGVVSFDEVPVSQMRKIIAKRLAESMFSAPHFYLTMSIDMDNAVASRAKLNDVSKVKISFN